MNVSCNKVKERQWFRDSDRKESRRMKKRLANKQIRRELQKEIENARKEMLDT